MSDVKDMGANCIEATYCLEKHKHRRNAMHNYTQSQKQKVHLAALRISQGRAIYNAFPGTCATVRGASHVRIYPYQCIPVAPKYGVTPRRSVDRLRAGNAVK